MDLQVYVVAVLLLTGVAVGLAFDLLRALRAQVDPGPLASLCLDLGFWLVVTALTLTGMLLGNWGDMRFYVLLVVAGGALLYLSLASYVMLPVFSALLYAVGRALAGVAGAVALPCRVVWGQLGQLLRPARRWLRRLHEKKEDG